LTDGGTDLFVVPVSSVVGNTDFALKEWANAELKVPCRAKAHIATVERKLIVNVVVALNGTDQQILEERLRTWLQL
jgi:hypothetical protein